MLTQLPRPTRRLAHHGPPVSSASIFRNDKSSPKPGLSSPIVVGDQSSQSDDTFSHGSGKPSFAFLQSLLEFLGNSFFASLFLCSPVPVRTDRFDIDFRDFWSSLLGDLPNIDMFFFLFNYICYISIYP